MLHSLVVHSWWRYVYPRSLLIYEFDYATLPKFYFIFYLIREVESTYLNTKEPPISFPGSKWEKYINISKLFRSLIRSFIWFRSVSLFYLILLRPKTRWKISMNDLVYQVKRRVLRSGVRCPGFCKVSSLNHIIYHVYSPKNQHSLSLTDTHKINLVLVYPSSLVTMFLTLSSNFLLFAPSV